MKLAKWWSLKLVKWAMVEAMPVFANASILTSITTSCLWAESNSCKLILQISSERLLFKVYYQDGNDLLSACVHCEMKPLFVHSVFLQCFIITYWIFFPYCLIIRVKICDQSENSVCFLIVLFLHLLQSHKNTVTLSSLFWIRCFSFHATGHEQWWHMFEMAFGQVTKQIPEQPCIRSLSSPWLWKFLPCSCSVC